MALLVVMTVSLGVSLAVTPWIRKVAIRNMIGDYPGVRKVHSSFIPRMGGVGIVSGLLGGLVAAYIFYPGAFNNASVNLWSLLGALLLVTGLGIFDDIKEVGSLGKLVVQVLASVLVILSGLRISTIVLPFAEPIDLDYLDIPLTMLWLVGITNAVNLLDGLDGLATGVAAIASATLFGIGLYTSDMLLALTTFSLFFACLGFLRYNFHPASIFMGDTGSLLLGFLLACLSLRVINPSLPQTSFISMLVVILVLAVPIVDTSVAFFRRLRKGMHPLKPDKEHIHHRLMDLGLTHRQTVVAIYAISVVNSTLAVLLLKLDSLYSTILLVIVFAGMVFSIRRLGYIEEMRARRNEETPPIQPLSVARIIDRAILVIGDLAAIILAFLVSYWFRFHSGSLESVGYVPLQTYIQNPSILVLAVGWLTLFVIAGLYEIPWDVSRIDYGFKVLKTVVLGTLALFLLTLDFESVTVEGRLTTLVYGASVGFFVLLIRMWIIAIERKYEILGFRRRNTLLVGTSKTAEDIVREIRERPGLKYGLVGVVDRNSSTNEFMNLPILGDQESIPDLVKKHNVEEILIATPYDSREEILDIVARCNGMVPTVKVAPESMDVLSGFRIQEVIGHPLIRLFPTNLTTLGRITKRLMDIVVALLVLVPLLPLWLAVALFIKLDSRGPIFFVQERVGRKGRTFSLYKFRSMVHEAEKETGPVWATADDKRVTRFGRFLRRLRIDEIPQFLNVLKGEMSLVGPRPERPFFVDQLKKEVSYYTRRLLVRPGITGWAQVKLQYDRSLDDVRQKIKYDLYYLENMSLILDIKILLRTIIVALTGRGTR